MKPHYKPLLDNAVLGPEALAPPENWLEGRNSGLVPGSTKSESVFLRLSQVIQALRQLTLFIQGHFNCLPVRILKYRQKP